MVGQQPAEASTSTAPELNQEGPTLGKGIGDGQQPAEASASTAPKLNQEGPTLGKGIGDGQQPAEASASTAPKLNQEGPTPGKGSGHGQQLAEAFASTAPMSSQGVQQGEVARGGGPAAGAELHEEEPMPVPAVSAIKLALQRPSSFQIKDTQMHSIIFKMYLVYKT